MTSNFTCYKKNSLKTSLETPLNDVTVKNIRITQKALKMNKIPTNTSFSATVGDDDRLGT